jgi:hypothetical protein
MIAMYQALYQSMSCTRKVFIMKLAKAIANVGNVYVHLFSAFCAAS